MRAGAAQRGAGSGSLAAGLLGLSGEFLCIHNFYFRQTKLLSVSKSIAINIIIDNDNGTVVGYVLIASNK